jgi:hypothetical protein
VLRCSSGQGGQIRDTCKPTGAGQGDTIGGSHYCPLTWPREYYPAESGWGTCRRRTRHTSTAIDLEMAVSASLEVRRELENLLWWHHSLGEPSQHGNETLE